MIPPSRVYVCVCVMGRGHDCCALWVASSPRLLHVPVGDTRCAMPPSPRVCRCASLLTEGARGPVLRMQRKSVSQSEPGSVPIRLAMALAQAEPHSLRGTAR